MGSSALPLPLRFNQLDRSRVEGLSELIEGHHRRVAKAALQVADVLLAKSREVSELLLRQSAFRPKAAHIPAD